MMKMIWAICNHCGHAKVHAKQRNGILQHKCVKELSVNRSVMKSRAWMSDLLTVNR